MKLLPYKVYREEADHRMEDVWLDDDIYAKATETFVIVNTDAVVINRRKKTLLLAKRNVLPIKDWWIIGGRMHAGEIAIESMQRCFKSETSLDLGQDRFQFVALFRTLWSNRKLEPQERGADNLMHVFVVEVTNVELAKISLDPNEYESGGLREFTRDEIVKTHPLLVDLYDEIFRNGIFRRIFRRTV